MAQYDRGKSEHVLGEIGQDQVGRDRRHVIEPRLAELALDVELLGKAEAAMGLHAHVGGGPGRLGGEQLGHVGLCAAVLAGLVERAASCTISSAARICM